MRTVGVLSCRRYASGSGGIEALRPDNAGPLLAIAEEVACACVRGKNHMSTYLCSFPHIRPQTPLPNLRSQPQNSLP